MNLPEGKFRIVLADPPWSFKTYSPKGDGRSANQHYSVMTLEDIKAMPVADLADKDCVLLMWATMPMLPEALETIKAWGFKFKTVAFTWVKMTKGDRPFTGMGYWTRSNAELLLLATRGKPKRVNKDVKQIMHVIRREHSRKPDEQYGRIERLLGDVPRIELFARTERPGWTSWGNQVEKFSTPQEPPRGAEPVGKSEPRKRTKS